MLCASSGHSSARNASQARGAGACRSKSKSRQFAEKNRITNGKITREQFRRFLDQTESALFSNMQFVGTTDLPALVGQAEDYKVHTVRWSVSPDLDGEGLLLEPNGVPKACIVAVPDADQTPEMIAGLASGVAYELQFARMLAECGCRVVVPVLINRKDTLSGNISLSIFTDPGQRERFTNQTHREFIYRMSYEMGRHVIAYEVQRILAAVDWFAKDKDHPPIGVFGYGEGGLLALYSAALDPRIDATVVSGCFGPLRPLKDGLALLPGSAR